jgi:hypothetical protein
MKVPKYILMIFLSLSFSDCQIGKLAGTYQTDSGYAMVSEYLRLKKNNEFHYQKTWDLGGHIGTGRWSIQNDTLILNSTLAFSECFDIEKSMDTQLDSLVIMIFINQSSLPYTPLQAWYSDEVEDIETDENGVAILKKGLDSLMIYSSPFILPRPLCVSINKYCGGMLTIRINEKCFGKLFLNEEKFLVRPDSLLPILSRECSYFSLPFFKKK